MLFISFLIIIWFFLYFDQKCCIVQISVKNINPFQKFRSLWYVMVSHGVSFKVTMVLSHVRSTLCPVADTLSHPQDMHVQQDCCHSFASCMAAFGLRPFVSALCYTVL